MRAAVFVLCLELATAASGAAASAAPGAFTRAEDAAPDTSVSGFLNKLADSTSVYFGNASARPDTAGLDSALAFGLAHPHYEHGGRTRPHFQTDFNFNRVDGPVYGFGLGMDLPRHAGDVSGMAHYAAGPNDWLWSARYRADIGDPEENPWRIEVRGGLETIAFDRERNNVMFSVTRALATGTDEHHYLRHDGIAVALDHRFGPLELGASYRDAVEKPITTSAAWSLFGDVTRDYDNVAVPYGRARETGLLGTLALGRLPFSAELFYQTSGHGIGSDFEYRRYRAALVGEVPVARVATVIPQLVYGHLTGQALPQASFFLGGSRTMRSITSGQRGGTGLAAARLEVLGTQNILEVMHLPHPAMFPLQLGVFGAAGAVWGVDPYGGPTRSGVDWPDPEHWTGEVGAALVYQPGFPDPAGQLRINFTAPVGPSRASQWISIAYTRSLDFLKGEGK